DYERISSMEELTETHGTISLNFPRPARYRRYGERLAAMLAQWNHPNMEGAGR
ncbi:hypothetical protein L195_g061061, partial [Trifolium pratense]